MKNFDKQTVMLTGAAGNLGQAVAALLHQAGARLVLLDRSAQALQANFGDPGPDRRERASPGRAQPQVERGDRSRR